jgi:hypothetical protein
VGAGSVAYKGGRASRDVVKFISMSERERERCELRQQNSAGGGRYLEEVEKFM